MECLFCKIVAGQIPANVVKETRDWMAFEDINPQAPCHVLLIPKTHISGISGFEPEHAETLGKLMLAAREVAELKGVSDGGFRVTINDGEQAGQTVHHLHLHVLGGRDLTWPPG